jgi:hypothetical protein
MTSQVTASSLNLRDAPNGAKLSVLIRGARLQVLAKQEGWAQVSAAGRVGWVSSAFIAETSEAAASITAPALPTGVTMPPPDNDASPVRVAGQNALSPDGQIFARRFRSGFFTNGETKLGVWLDGLGAAPSGISASTIRVVRAMSVNEGRLEAVNSYDECHLSFGIFQWTAGQGAAAGELAVLLAQIKAAEPAAFQDSFGRYGLDVVATSATATTGELTLSGQPLKTIAQKDVLRSASWAYRFWRAGHHPTIRECELALAAERIGRFISAPTSGHPLGAWLTSEHGAALVLDEHVNRPGHVPKTLTDAIAGLSLTPGKSDPAGWDAEDEARLIDAYLVARDKTNMTDSKNRALRIAERVRAGELSDARGSYVG